MPSIHDGVVLRRSATNAIECLWHLRWCVVVPSVLGLRTSKMRGRDVGFVAKRKKHGKSHDGPHDVTVGTAPTVLAHLDFYVATMVTPTEANEGVGEPTGSPPLVAPTAVAEPAPVPGPPPVPVARPAIEHEPQPLAAEPEPSAIAMSDGVVEPTPDAITSGEHEPEAAVATPIVEGAAAAVAEPTVSSEDKGESKGRASSLTATIPPVIATAMTPIADPVPNPESEARPVATGSNGDRKRAAPEPPSESTKKHRRRLPQPIDTGPVMPSPSELPCAPGVEGSDSPPRQPTSYWARPPKSPAPPSPDDLGDLLSSEASETIASGNRARRTRPLHVADTVAAAPESSESSGSNRARYWAKPPGPPEVTATVAGLQGPTGTIASEDREGGTGVVREMPVPSWSVQDGPDVARVFCAFVDNDAGYLGWLARHGDGFVLNCHREPGPDYLVLHQATCSLISTPATKGRSRTKDPIKVCATWRGDLEAWADNRVACAPKPCRRCLAGN
jgi:hypothetical protein